MLAGVYVSVARTLPTLQLAADIPVAETTRIYDDSDPPVLLAELHGLENRETLTPEQIPQAVKDAVVAVEDERFYEHKGVDFFAILRALWANITHREIVQGGSTITQQLIKNAFLSNEETVERKFREAALAYQLEKRWSKDKILTEYLNIVYFGQGAYGVGAAARTYFGVSAADLTLDQAALLAGLPQAPSAYSPRRDADAALERRDVVLNKMYQQGYITSRELQEALAAPLVLADAQNQDEMRLPYWVEMVREQLVARYGASTVLRGGLRVYTTVDLRLQEVAEAAVAHVLDRPDDPAAALVAIDVETGRLVAMVGGRSFEELQFNLAIQGRRQPGSAFKPFVLVTALEQGISPEATYDSGPVTIDLPGGAWEVSSPDLGPITLEEATARSSNGVYARLITEVGADAVARTAHEMGISTDLGSDPNPAIALGGLSTGVSPLEMAVAYATLATGGERLSASVTFSPAQKDYPITIARVVSADGTTLDESTVLRTRVIDAGLAAIATDCLERVIQSGTGTAAEIGRPAAGKTGTTQNHADAWFVGYTPELVTAVWVGYPSGQRPMTDVHGAKVTGGSLPAQIWAEFMKEALAGRPVADFPGGGETGWVTVEVCSDSHLPPNEYCPRSVSRLFRKGECPVELCPLHVPTEIPVPDVTGMTLEEGLATLKGVHFTSSTIDERMSARPAGTIVGQDPRAGTGLLQGETVTLYVSTGENLTTVPDVVGVDVGAAEAKLAAAKLTAVVTAVPDPAAPGTVLQQKPAAGTAVRRGSTVSLVVSAGVEETPPSG